MGGGNYPLPLLYFNQLPLNPFTCPCRPCFAIMAFPIVRK
ncbi:MAG: hypothetical protein MRECE_45c008 [Mycoplasmataceae bacterium CE_OT135]|nr:MAG: hypothetical protein MRECE_45c008 [Mycoplasmataceae bacterium CE_OT135]